MATSKYRKAISITMYSAFRFFTLEQITSRLNSALDRARLSKPPYYMMAYGLMMYSSGLVPRALSARLVGSSSAAVRGRRPLSTPIV